MSLPCVIARHINGITLNDYEFVLDGPEEVRVFNNKMEAISFLKQKGVADDDIYNLNFFNASKLINDGLYEEVMI